jgi:hypothetical protein
LKRVVVSVTVTTYAFVGRQRTVFVQHAKKTQHSARANRSVEVLPQAALIDLIFQCDLA